MERHSTPSLPGLSPFCDSGRPAESVLGVGRYPGLSIGFAVRGGVFGVPEGKPWIGAPIGLRYFVRLAGELLGRD
jgi:hypothetical protein